MAEVKITTDNLKQVASQMNHWTEDMKSIVNDMNNKVRNTNNWQDPRAEQFRQQATMTAQQLLLHMDNFSKMSKFLQKYAQMQEEAERAQNMRMSNI